MADAMNVKIAKAFLDMSGHHYPERLGVFIGGERQRGRMEPSQTYPACKGLDPPSVFTLLWKAISSFVDPKTYKKIRSVSSSSCICLHDYIKVRRLD